MARLRFVHLACCLLWCSQAHQGIALLFACSCSGGTIRTIWLFPWDDGSYEAYSSLRGSLVLSGSNLTDLVYAASGGAPYVFHSDLHELASMFSNKELAVIANVGSLVQPTTRDQYLR